MWAMPDDFLLFFTTERSVNIIQLFSLKGITHRYLLKIKVLNEWLKGFRAWCLQFSSAVVFNMKSNVNSPPLLV